MTNDERRSHREDAQKDMAVAMGLLSRATRRLNAIGVGTETTVADLREVQDRLVEVMEFNAAVTF